MKARIIKDIICPQFTKTNDGNIIWFMVELKKDEEYDLISNDCGPVGITMDCIIIPNQYLTCF